MINGGFYIKARAIQDSNISYAPPHIREIWDWLIKEANFKDMPTCGVVIKRGQCFTSYQEILDGLSWMVGARKMRYTKSQCETAMKYLMKHGMVTTARTTRGMIVTICKYDTYQAIENYETYTETVSKPSRDMLGSESISKKEERKERKKKEFAVSQLSASQSVEVFNSVKAFFLKLYASHFGTEYYFIGKDGTKIQDIIKKVVFKMKEKDSSDNFTIEQISEATNLIIKASLQLDNNFISTNFNLSIIDQKFNDIYSSLKNGKRTTTTKQSSYASAKAAFGAN